MNRAKRGIIVLSTALLVGSCLPVTAHADTSAQIQDQLDQAQSNLDELYASAEDASSELNKTMDDLLFTEQDISEIRSQIKEGKTELDDAQATLRQTVAAQYKDGTISLLSIILSSKNLEDFIGRIYYANKVSESYAQQIQVVKDLQEDLAKKQASLEEQKASLEQLRDEQEERKEQLDAKAAEVEAYVNGLSAELQEALAAEAAARAEAERREAEAALAAAQQAEAEAAAQAKAEAEAQQEQAEEAQKAEEEAEQQQRKEQTEENSVETSNQQSTSTTSGSLSNMEARTAVVNYVLAQLDKPYVWATHGPDSFDCSGLTGAAYQSIGYFIGYSDSYQEQYCNKPASEAVYGDIVWRPGHVGICIGNGVTVEAHSPASGIGYGLISNFQRSGSPLG